MTFPSNPARVNTHTENRELDSSTIVHISVADSVADAFYTCSCLLVITIWISHRYNQRNMSKTGPV